MKNWAADCSCLVVFDNADDLTALKTAWLGTSRCSVLLTTRDSTVATTLAAHHLEVNILTDEDGCQMLLTALESKDSTVEERESGRALSRAFGGLPLALTQIAGFVKQRKMALEAFLPLYEKYPDKIDSRKAPGTDYEHALSTVWDVSLQKLTTSTTQFLALMSFFDPDSIHEEVILQGSNGLGDVMSFLSDELEYVRHCQITKRWRADLFLSLLQPR